MTNSNGIIEKTTDYGARIYRGTREALLAAGVARPEWFPDGEKKWKASRTMRGVQGRKTTLRALLGSADFVLTISPTHEEWRASRAAAENVLREDERAIRKAREAIDKLPRDSEAFRADLLNFACNVKGFIAGYASRAHGGYAMTAEGREAIEAAMENLRAAIEVAEITYSAKARAVEETCIRARALGSDVGFERFMGKALDPTSGEAS